MGPYRKYEERNHVYGAIILSDNSYHFILRPFHVTTDSAALSAISVCREPGSMRLNSTHSNLYDVFNSPYLEEVLGDAIFNRHLVQCASKIHESGGPRGSD